MYLAQVSTDCGLTCVMEYINSAHVLNILHQI